MALGSMIGVLAMAGCASHVSDAEGPSTHPAPSVSTSSPDSSTSDAVVQIETDHLVYESVEALRTAAENVFEGTVVSHVVVPGNSIGTDDAGDPITAPPSTEYSVLVSQVWRGSLPAGSHVVVVQLGGDEGDTLYVADGGTTLADGVTSVFFSGPAIQGHVAPLAGGAAVGAKNPDGTYTLSTDVSGSESVLVVTETQLSGGSGLPSGNPTATPTGSPTSSPPPTVAFGHKAKIRGVAKVGSRIRLVHYKATVTGGAAAYTFRWYANGKKIPGAKKQTLLLTKSMKGKKVKVEVTARVENIQKSIRVKAGFVR